MNERTLDSHHHLPRWIENKRALMGDSFRLMLPGFVQGAAQPIENPVVFTISLFFADDIGTTLRFYKAQGKSRD